MRESDWLNPSFLSGALEPLNWSHDPDEWWLVDVGPEGIFGKKEKFDADRMVEFLDRLEGRVTILEQKFNVQLPRVRSVITKIYKELGVEPMSG